MPLLDLPALGPCGWRSSQCRLKYGVRSVLLEPVGHLVTSCSLSIIEVKSNTGALLTFGTSGVVCQQALALRSGSGHRAPWAVVIGSRRSDLMPRPLLVIE